MKKFNKWSKWIKTKRNKRVKDEMKQEDGATIADDQHSKETAVALVPVEEADESTVLLPLSDIPLVPLPQENAQEHPVNLVEDNIHVALTVDDCKVCKLRTDVMKPIANEEILPVEFIARVDEAYYDLVPVEKRKEIHKAVLEDIKIQYPSYYDFCVIASEDDYPRANEFKLLVSNAFSLRGCMLYDGFIRLGSDIFQSYEEMIEHSTKVFFFITDSFNADNFCRRLQNGTIFNFLMDRAKKVREKCVPIFPDRSHKVPLALSGIAGIIPRNHDTLDQSLNTTFTVKTRQELAELNHINNGKRAVKYLQLFKDKVMYLKQEQDALEDRIASEATSDDIVQLYNPLSADHNCGAIEEDKVQRNACQFNIAGSSDESVLGSAASYVEKTGSVKNCVDSDIEPVLQPNLGTTNTLDKRPKNRKPKPKTVAGGESSIVSGVVPVLKDIMNTFHDGNTTYNVSGNHTRIGHQIILNVCNQQTCCLSGSSNAHCCGEGANKDYSSIDHNETSSECNDSADSDVDLSESIQLRSREPSVETDRSSSCSECSDACSSKMSEVRL